MAKIFKKKEGEADRVIEKTTVMDGFRFGIGFFLAFLAGWIVLVILALIISLVARSLGYSL